MLSTARKPWTIPEKYLTKTIQPCTGRMQSLLASKGRCWCIGKSGGQVCLWALQAEVLAFMFDPFWSRPVALCSQACVLFAYSDRFLFKTFSYIHQELQQWKASSKFLRNYLKLLARPEDCLRSLRMVCSEFRSDSFDIIPDRMSNPCKMQAKPYSSGCWRRIGPKGLSSSSARWCRGDCADLERPPCRIGSGMPEGRVSSENPSFIGIFRAAKCNAQEGAHQSRHRINMNQQRTAPCFLVVTVRRASLWSVKWLFMVGSIIVACRLGSLLLVLHQFNSCCSRSCGASSRQQLYDGMLRTLVGNPWWRWPWSVRSLCQIVLICCYKLLRSSPRVFGSRTHGKSG